ncbi:MAG TPA: DUF2490 domain-containing protein [Lacibacter sp.]|nr:DUF2490 domain-containing protein [Lacibacter sp.]HMO88813.1 DUF2490 domain-containing protein [Lacibacter sp.]HMP86802.1 DUF2490 domain-containing protein [Lacibacter sp.]
MKTTLRHCALLLFPLWVSLPVLAQLKQVYPHQVFWSKVEINQLDKNYRWGYGADLVYRRKSGLEDRNMFSEPLRISFRPWINYQFSPNARLSVSPLGYMKTHEYLAKPEDLLRQPYRELRTTLQFFHHFKPGNPRFMHTWRYRYEMRWQENPVTDNWRYFNRFRIRYRLRYTFKGTDFYENNNLYAMVSNEIGINFGKNVLYNTFNQNRFYAGVGYRFLNTVRAEARYVNRIRTRGSTGLEFDHGRGLMLTLFVDQITGMGKQDSYKIQYTD